MVGDEVGEGICIGVGNRNGGEQQAVGKVHQGDFHCRRGDTASTSEIPLEDGGIGGNGCNRGAGNSIATVVGGELSDGDIGRIG